MPKSHYNLIVRLTNKENVAATIITTIIKGKWLNQREIFR